MQTNPQHVLKLTPIGPLTFVYYDEDGLVGAHCLELDLGGQGETRQEAIKDLQEAIESFLEHCREAHESPLAAHPAPEMQLIEDREQFVLILARVTEGGHAEAEERVLFTTPPPAAFNPELMLA